MTGAGQPPPLPRLMVSPTGARRTKADHPALPIATAEIVDTARACWAAGARGIHLHVRDEEGRHSLDVGRYREAMAALQEALPELLIQVTSEAAGQYGVDAQRKMVLALGPDHVSAAIREFLPDPTETAATKAFYHHAFAAGIDVQHIVYSPGELECLVEAIHDGIVPGQAHRVQLVLGRYDGSVPSDPGDLAPFLEIMARQEGLDFDFMVCAFGKAETRCLAEAVRRGGKARVGFENSLWNADGRLAKDNAERVAEVYAAIENLEAVEG